MRSTVVEDEQVEGISRGKVKGAIRQCEKDSDPAAP